MNFAVSNGQIDPPANCTASGGIPCAPASQPPQLCPIREGESKQDECPADGCCVGPFPTTPPTTHAPTHAPTNGTTPAPTESGITPSPSNATDPTPAPTNTPTQASIIQVLQAKGNFSTLIALLQKADLEKTLSGTQKFTIFAPQVLAPIPHRWIGSTAMCSSWPARLRCRRTRLSQGCRSSPSTS